MEKIKSSEITPEQVYLNRRQFMKGVGALALGAVALSACAPAETPQSCCECSGGFSYGRSSGGRRADLRPDRRSADR